MGSPAMNYFSSLDPAEQERIRATWGGNDLVEAWYQNGVNAGGITPVSQAQSGGWTPASIRQHFQGMGYDTFDNIDDNTINKWMAGGLWDAARGVFRPERQIEGDVQIDYRMQPDFKPQDCPTGYSPSGSGPGARCVPNDSFGPQAASQAPFKPVDPFMGQSPAAGAVPGRAAEPVAGQYGGIMGGQGTAKTPAAPVSRPVLAQDSLQAVMTPLQGDFSQRQPFSGVGLGGVNPLQQTMAPLQGRKRATGLNSGWNSSWFGG